VAQQSVMAQRAVEQRATGRPQWTTVVVLLALALAVVGVGIAAYLAYENLQGDAGACTITKGCSTVQKSSYGKLLGVPVSVPGLLLYLALAGAAVAWLRNLGGQRELITFGAFFGALFGLGFSAYLTYVEAFVLNAWCIYCIVSALIMGALFLAWGSLFAYIYRQHRQEDALESPRPAARSRKRR